MAINIVGNEIQISSGIESTATLLADGGVQGLGNATILNGVLGLDATPIRVLSGGELILDDEEGAIDTDRSIIVDSGGILHIGRFTADFESTGVAKQTSGVAWYSTATAANDGGNNNIAQFNNGSTVNWYSAMQTSSPSGYLFIGGTCNMNWFGGSRCIGTATIGRAACRIRQNSTDATFDGRIAGSADTAPFTCSGQVRVDFFQDVTPVFGGGYTAGYTAAGGFQVVGNGTQQFITIPGLGNTGLLDNLVGDSFGSAGIRLINPGTAARYNVSHNNGGTNAWTFMTQELSDTIFDSAGNAIENAFWYTRDQGNNASPPAPTQDFNDRTSAPPATFAYANSNILDPVFGGALPGTSRYDTNIVYSGRTDANGVMTGEVVTRLLAGGLSGGQAAAGDAFTDNNTRTNYRFTEDNNDTAAFILAAYGQDRVMYDQNMVGIGVATNFNRIMTPDAVIAIAGVDAATAATETANNAIATWENLAGVIEHNQTPQTDTDTASLFRYNNVTAEKAWTGVLNGAAQIAGGLVLNTGAGGIQVRGNTMGGGLNTTVTGNLGWDVGVNSISTNVESFGGIALRGAAKDLESTTAVSNVVLGGGQTSFVTNPGSGITFEDSETISGLTDLNGLTFQGTCTVNLTADIDIRDNIFTGIPTFAGTGVTVMLTAAQAATFSILDAGGESLDVGESITIAGVTYSVPAQNYTFTLQDPNFRGVVGLAYRLEGLAGITSWIPLTATTTGHSDADAPGVYDFTNAIGTIDSIDSNHVGFTGRNEIFAFTVGAGFSLTTTPVVIAPGPATVNIPIQSAVDVNYNSTVDISGVTLDVEVEERTGNTGQIDIQITGAQAPGLDGAQTNRMMGMARNDVDYLQEVFDAGRTTDYVRFETQEATLVDGSMNVVFSKIDASTAQQFITDVTVIGNTAAGVVSESADGVTPDVISQNGTAGLSSAAAVNALNQTARLISVEQMNNYLVSNGLSGGATADRLIGIRPKREGFSPNGDYTIT